MSNVQSQIGHWLLVIGHWSLMIAFVFPGQGSQKVGMGRELHEAFPVVRSRFDKASEILGFDLSRLCFEGPEEELTATLNAQPAILTLSCACGELVKAEGIEAQVVAGHSLGEYTALVAAGSLTFEDAVRLVRQRGELMHQATQGTMAAILGLSTEQVEEVCREAAAAGIAQPANFNAPGQVVISGEVAAVEAALEVAQTKGASRVIKLPVSGAFHSPLMREAAEKMAQLIQVAPVQRAQMPVVTNVTGNSVQEPDAIRAALTRQMTSAVLWEKSVRTMWAMGARTFVELGPGRVLSGLIRRIEKEATVMNVEDSGSLEKIVQGLRVKG
jgi:[acyl-carrier-protein] S-malonyltransferase